VGGAADRKRERRTHDANASSAPSSIADLAMPSRASRASKAAGIDCQEIATACILHV
jgi:hypothetical protein